MVSAASCKDAQPLADQLLMVCATRCASERRSMTRSYAQVLHGGGRIVALLCCSSSQGCTIGCRPTRQTLRHWLAQPAPCATHDAEGGRPSITAYAISSFKNPLAAMLDSNKFTGLNYKDWLRNLNLVLASEKLLYTIEKCPPKEAPADISPEELVTLKQCNKFTGLNYKDWLRNLNLVLASEKLLYTIEKCPPKEAPADISPEELVTLKQ
ncbi:hypothetical protein F511_13783 [Dorcoceras hygrometricum]|uniref:Uncharacterized protein n=1 Tax=Dorcoceras hygrometricum TaxID=472368 RepID=A0A2Z7CXM2_9LAMI|nr:hypothetical protein F511_13783 [Dorcoceras hygrometricum]